MRTRTVIASLSVALTSVIGGVTAYGLSEHPSTTPPAGISAACQTAVNAQDGYAQLADQQGYLTTFTNQQTLAANDIDGSLVENMIKAGCPETIRYFDMLTGKWVN